MKYVKPVMEILELEQGDVITNSNTQLGDDGNYDPNTGKSDYEGWN